MVSERVQFPWWWSNSKDSIFSWQFQIASGQNDTYLQSSIHTHTLWHCYLYQVFQSKWKLASSRVHQKRWSTCWRTEKENFAKVISDGRKCRSISWWFWRENENLHFIWHGFNFVSDELIRIRLNGNSNWLAGLQSSLVPLPQYSIGEQAFGLVCQSVEFVFDTSTYSIHSIDRRQVEVIDTGQFVWSVILSIPNYAKGY